MQAPPPIPSPRSRLSIPQRFALNQVACLVIALVMWVGHENRNAFGQILVYSLLIGNCCWIFIDLGRVAVARWLHSRRGPPAATSATSEGWPGWLWMGPIVVLGAVGGYTLGYSAAAALLGHRGVSLHEHTSILLFSVLAALIVCYAFYARERLYQQRLEAEAARRLISETQLQLLQTQLEPHMLFNTLANLRVLIGLDPPRAQAMLDHLIAFLRTTLSGSRNGDHALATEFEALADYLALMTVRMGARLQHRLALPAELRTLPVPALLLQPLVENAIKHGLEPQVAGGRIDISARRDGRWLELRVRDTGAGLARTPAAEGSHFGLEQVRQRLAHRWGEAATLTLQPGGDDEAGTEAVLRLPLHDAPEARSP
ncbi:sensor histidine kinase [Pseudorhodoferax sp.]|uniref:sensor histidine kinase n=1 Tax=Pseudorhodoferax sp. TaxID=1993553 RepID=UPI002DD650F5|nr:histidine kinase [Pseudorhodoferax sp.]